MWSPRYFWRHWRIHVFLCLAFVSTPVAGGQVSISDPQSLPVLPYEPVADFFQLSPGDNFLEPAGIALNSGGTSTSFTAERISWGTKEENRLTPDYAW